MKHIKWIVPLAVVVLLLMIALPAAADDPFGGPPSKTSGNGTTTWAAIYIGGTWDNKRTTSTTYTNPNTFSIEKGNEATVEYDRYVTNWSAKITIPSGGSSRWFKFDTVRSRDVEVYIDDVPKWGAAYRYFGDLAECKPQDFTPPLAATGNGNCDAADNLLRLGDKNTIDIAKKWLATENRYDFGWDSTNNTAGIYGVLYSPEFIARPSYFWPTPNNALLTTRTGSQINIGNTAGSRGGYRRGSCSVTGSCEGDGLTMILEDCAQNKRGDGNTHLQCTKIRWDGWVYLRVFNAMIWDGDAQVGTRFTPVDGFDFPCDNCPYPFNPYFRPNP